MIHIDYIFNKQIKFFYQYKLVILINIFLQAGNILVDTRGAIKLGDFGVSACLFDSGDRQRTRNTFVGTPCWCVGFIIDLS